MSTVSDFIANFRETDAPFVTKVGMAVRNNLIKLRTRKDCCGHLGEPGC